MLTKMDKDTRNMIVFVTNAVAVCAGLIFLLAAAALAYCGAYLMTGAVYAFFYTAHHPEEKKYLWTHMLAWPVLLPAAAFFRLQELYYEGRMERKRVASKALEEGFRDDLLQEMDREIDNLRGKH